MTCTETGTPSSNRANGSTYWLTGPNRGLASSTSVAIVAFGEQGYQIDMDPLAPGLQLSTSPSADADANGIPDVEQALRGLQRSDFGSALRSDYGATLRTVQQTISDLKVAPGNANMLFVSDGEPNNPNDYGNEVAQLRDLQVNLSAFGAGRMATLHTLRTIDPQATAFGNPAELLDAFDIIAKPSGGSGHTTPGSSDGLWMEPGLAGVTFYLDANNNRQLGWADLDLDGAWDLGEGERWTLSQTDDPGTAALDETGRFQFDNLQAGVYIVREIVPDGWRPSPPTTFLADETLLNYLPFNGDTLDQITGTPAKNYGADPADDRFSLADRSYFFDGYAWMRAPLPNLPLDAAPRTLSLWVRSVDGQQDASAEHIANFGAARTLEAFGLMAYFGGKWSAYMHSADLNSGIAMDTAWHHLTITYDGATARLFVDGQSKSAAARDLATAPGPLIIGIRPDLNWTTTFDGSVDDIRIYDRALSIAEVANLYNWERSRAILDDAAYVIRVNPADFIDDVTFGDCRIPPPPVTLTGTTGNDSFHVRLDSTGAILQVWVNVPVSSPPTTQFPLADVNLLRIDALDGDDSLTIDRQFGSPLASVGLHIDAGRVNLSVVNGPSLVELADLTLGPAATLDVNDSSILVRASRQTRHDIASTIAQSIRSGRAGSIPWAGPGIISSAAKARSHTTLASLINDKGIGQPIFTTFAATPVDTNCILVRYTWDGDANLNGVVNADDYFLIDSNCIPQKPGYYNGDFNFDSVVNADDYFLIDSAFIGQSGPLAGGESAAATTHAAPKPADSATVDDAVIVQGAKKQEADSLLAELFSTEPVL